MAFLPFKCYVPYAVEVRDPKNLKKITNALLKKDPSSWESDPNFYELLGSNFRQFVKEMTMDNISVVYGG